MNRTFCLLLAAAMLTAACGRVEPPAAAARHAEVLAAELGTWRSRGWVHDGREGWPLEAAWRCRPGAPGKVNDCKWRLMSRNPLLGIERFDPALATFMHTLEPSGPGLWRGRWEFVHEGSPGVGINEVRVVSAREWQQNTAIDIAGRRVLQLSLTHRRVR
jgi:hypothetical protein